jgi:hypothetical protein
MGGINVVYVVFHIVFFSSRIYSFAPRVWTIDRTSRSLLSSSEESYSSDDNPFTRTAAPEVPLSSDISLLPDTFSDAITKAALRTMNCISSGQKRMRIDFDTSIGDQTYTSIKNTIPMMKEFSVILSQAMDLSMMIDDGEDDEIDQITIVEGTSAPIVVEAEKTMRIFFPDMGQAALARRDWKMGSDVSEVPPCVYTANIKNDDIQPTDKVAILLCPLASEADAVIRLMASCTASNVPLILINPDLINMDQGFGVSKFPYFLVEYFRSSFYKESVDLSIVYLV